VKPFEWWVEGTEWSNSSSYSSSQHPITAGDIGRIYKAPLLLLRVPRFASSPSINITTIWYSFRRLTRSLSRSVAMLNTNNRDGRLICIYIYIVPADDRNPRFQEDLPSFYWLLSLCNYWARNPWQILKSGEDERYIRRAHVSIYITPWSLLLYDRIPPFLFLRMSYMLTSPSDMKTSFYTFLPFHQLPRETLHNIVIIITIISFYSSLLLLLLVCHYKKKYGLNKFRMLKWKGGGLNRGERG